jgi:hypothetical protein
LFLRASASSLPRLVVVSPIFMPPLSLLMC